MPTDAHANSSHSSTAGDSSSIPTKLRAATGDEQRTFLAGERTMLAWIRTSLALMGFGFLVAKFGLFLREVVALRSNPSGTAKILVPQTGVSLWIGLALVLLGVFVNATSAQQHIRFVRQFAGTELAAASRLIPQLILLFVLFLLGASLAIYLLLVGQ
ncbi:MAG TPA: DUF202 domain-containing protein [Pirellulales bacterium]|jgi:putative membrane protein